MITLEELITLQSIVDSIEEMSVKIPVSYKLGLYFVHSITKKGIVLVSKNQLYYVTADTAFDYSPILFSFEPKETILVGVNDHEFEKIRAAILDETVQVSVKYAELYAEPEQVRQVMMMKIMLLDDEEPKLASGETFTLSKYNGLHYEYEVKNGKD